MTRLQLAVGFCESIFKYPFAFFDGVFTLKFRALFENIIRRGSKDNGNAVSTANRHSLFRTKNLSAVGNNTAQTREFHMIFVAVAIPEERETAVGIRNFAASLTLK